MDIGPQLTEVKSNSISIYIIIAFSRIKGLVGKVEKSTHVDINKDGYIGGRPGHHRPPHPKPH